MKSIVLGGVALGFLAGSSLIAQTRIDLSTEVRNPDFSSLPHTRPVQVGSALPAACSVGELFFNSAGGSNVLYACTASNTWISAAAAGLGNCVVNGSDLSCPGNIVSGTGSTAGAISLYEVALNGSNAVSIAAPDSVAGSYTLKLPAGGPVSGQSLVFAAPDMNGVAQASWGSGGGSTGPATQISLYGSSGGTDAISLAAPSGLSTSYTLQLPAGPPLSGQTLSFGAPDSQAVAQGVWTTPGSGSGGNIFEGLYSGLPATCAEGSLYLFTDSLYTFARCTSNNWQHFFEGRQITPISALSLSTLVSPAQVTVSAAHGYEQMSAPPGSSVALRRWAAPSSGPFTSYVVLRVPAMLDNADYRTWHVGFGDSSGNNQLLTCGVGIAQLSGFWCRITRLDSNGNFISLDSSVTNIPSIYGTIVIMLQNDGSRLHFGISSDGISSFEFGSVPVASYLSSPSQLVYGFENSAPGASVSVNFLGVF